jgi:glycosyltransferase involved in cell wall biosynthesis
MTTVAQRTVSRNDPCPCGSGRRFKDCHGSLRGAAPAGSSLAAEQPAPMAATPRPRSRYRPAGNDWAEIDPDTSDRLGAMMELALEHQIGERVRDAERLYRAVLEEAPHTHDALHMLGVVRLGLGDFSEAERLLRSAMALRPAYPAIEKNWSLVRRSIAARDRRGIEIVCEHALPLLQRSLQGAQRPRKPDAAGSVGQGLHLVGPAADATGDAAWVTERLAHLLETLAPTLWRPPSDHAVGASWTRIDRNEIDVATGRRPAGGAVILADIQSDTDGWLRDSIDRVLVFAQAALPSTYVERLRRIAADGSRPVALMFPSHAKARRFGCDGIVVPPPIDLADVADVAARPRVDEAALRVAAVGQDRRRIVIANDVELLTTIAYRAGGLALLDPGPLRYDVGMLPAVQCIARGAKTTAGFLADVDIYFHRRQPWWTEDEGRLFFGAMASGVPVLCHRESLYAEYVDEGVDGWLYDTDDAAVAMIDALRANRTRVRDAGAAARTKALRLFEPHSLATAYADAVTQGLRG